MPPPGKRPWDRDDDEDDRDDRPRRPRRDDDDEEDDDRPRRRRRRDDDDNRVENNGLATVAVVLGIISLCTGPLFGIAAIICGVIALNRSGKKSAATAGLVMGGVGTLLTPIILIALLLPAVTRVRDAAARMSDTNNMKQVGIALSAYDESNRALPAADGELSWRVAILPYLEQVNLYGQFNQKQPWNSQTNLPLSKTRIKTYVSNFDPPDSADTRYRVFIGPGALFEPGEPPPKLDKIKDGASNTILFVEAGDTVPWPQPKELPYDRNGPLPPLGVVSHDMFLVGMADGSVRPVKKSVSTAVLRGGIEPNDGKGFTE